MYYKFQSCDIDQCHVYRGERTSCVLYKASFLLFTKPLAFYAYFWWNKPINVMNLSLF